MYNAEDLLDNSNVRERFINRVDVLDNVKELLLLPNTEFATTAQVGKYYGVKTNVIRQIKVRHDEEFKEDGVIHCPHVKIKDMINSDSLSQLKIPPNGTLIFPKRAILRIGMLLRDSDVAKEVRTQLLNIEEQISNENKVADLDKEKQLVLDVVFGEDVPSRTVAIAELLDYKNRHIKEIEAKLDVSEGKNQALTAGILKWGRRESINRMVRKIAANVFADQGRYKYAKAWDKVRSQMLYKHNISVTKRLQGRDKNTTIFDVLDDNELALLVQSCTALCEQYNINIDDLFIEA